MQNLTTQKLTLSSYEIAEICNSRHNIVAATIERLFEKGVLHESCKTPRFYAPAGGGRPTRVYHLTKRDTLVVVSGYRDDIRARIIDRWMELENETSFRVPQTLPEALRLAAEQAEELDKTRPKAAAFDLIAKHSDDIGVRDIGRLLKIGQRRIAEFLLSHKWACRDYRSNKLKPAYYGIKQGYVKFCADLYTNKSGVEFVIDTLKITPRGKARLAQLVSRGAL